MCIPCQLINDWHFTIIYGMLMLWSTLLMLLMESLQLPLHTPSRHPKANVLTIVIWAWGLLGCNISINKPVVYSMGIIMIYLDPLLNRKEIQ